MIDLMKEKTENDERYYKIGNTHIFTQMGVEQFTIVKDEISKKRNQRIHIFELRPTSVDDLLKGIVDLVQNDTKVIIHVSHHMISYKRLVESYFYNAKEKEGSRIKKVYVIAERKPVKFSWIDRSDFSKVKRSIIFEFANDLGNYQLRTYRQDKEWTVLKNWYYHSNAAIRSKVELENMELFRDVIIKHFKRATPKGILGTFKSDDEIWDYITEQEEWAPENQ